MRCLFIHLLHFTSLIFPHSHLLCWGTCLGGRSISQNPVDRRWDPDQAAMIAPHAWHHHVIWIAWHEDVFSRWRRDGSPKVPDPGCRVGAQEFPSPTVPKDYCRMSCMRSGIVMQQQHPLVWHLRLLALNSSLKFFEIGLISSRIDCFIRRRKVQQGSAIGILTFWLPLVIQTLLMSLHSVHKSNTSGCVCQCLICSSVFLFHNVLREFFAMGCSCYKGKQLRLCVSVLCHEGMWRSGTR